MAEQVMDVRSSAAFLRQRWRTLAVAGVVGIALGCLYVARVPAELGSTTLVLLPVQNESTGGIAPDTQVRIAVSTPVLEKAGGSMSPALSAAEVKKRTKVATTTPQLIEIQAFADREQQAQALSQAVADAYIAMLRDNANGVVAQPVQDLRSREAALTKQLNALQTEITATSERARRGDPDSVTGRRDAQLLAQLTAEQADVALRLDQVKKSLSAYQTPEGAADEARVIQPAAPAIGPSLYRRIVTTSVLGALLAAAGTAMCLLIRRRRDPRLHARDDLADAVGSNVLADVHSRPKKSVAEWLAFLETYEPSAVEAWAFRQMLRALAAAPDSRDAARNGARQAPGPIEHPRSLTVIALAGDQRGAALGPQLAVCAASLGIVTRFVAATGHESAAALRAACATDRSSQLGTRLLLSEYEAPAQRTADLTIFLVVADRKDLTSHVAPDTEATVLAISPGVATREELARLAVAVDDAAARIDGIVVADPDPADRTTGRRTLDERAQRAPLPMRLTGGSQVPVSASGPEQRR